MLIMPQPSRPAKKDRDRAMLSKATIAGSAARPA